MKLSNVWCSNPKFYITPNFEVITNLKELELFYEEVKGRSISFDIETGGLYFWKSPIICFSFSVERGKAFVLPLYHQFLKPFWEDEVPIWNVIKLLLEDQNTEKIGYNIKFDINFCRQKGIRVAGPLFDGLVSFGLLDENSPKDLMTAADRFGMQYGLWDDKLWDYTSRTEPDFTLIPDEVLWLYTGIDATSTFELRDKMRRGMRKDNVYHIFENISIPLLRVVCEMEWEGVKLNVPLLEQYSADYANKIETKLAEIRKRVNDENFNPNSPKQLAEKLLVTLQGGKKTPTGRISTDEKVLSALAKKGNKVCENVLEYRSLNKIRSTYLEGFKELLDENGYIHTNYSIAHTVTGRISSSHPNLQNIPRVREGELNIRNLFTCEENERFIATDFAQVEQRVLAFYSKDKKLLKIFHDKEDIHRSVGADILKKKKEDVTHEERAKIKGVVYGTVYGRSAHDIAEEFNITDEEAQQYIDGYLASYPEMAKWREQQHRNSMRDHLLTTPFGRKRRFVGYNFLQSEEAQPILRKREIAYSLQNMRNMSYNFNIQSPSSDYLSISTRKIYDNFIKEGMTSKIIMSTHDSLHIKSPFEEVDKALEIVEQCMEQALRDDEGNEIELLVDGTVSDKWEE